MTSRSPSRPPAHTALPQELVQAESRGAGQLAAQLRDLIEERRRIVRLGEQQIAIVEVSALYELLDTILESG